MDKFTFGRWQEQGERAYIQVHYGSKIIGTLNMSNEFVAHNHYSYDKTFDKVFGQANKHSGKKFNSHLECLSYLNEQVKD